MSTVSLLVQMVIRFSGKKIDLKNKKQDIYFTVNHYFISVPIPLADESSRTKQSVQLMNKF